MKANRSFLSQEDAVSPVVGTILMVAIAVVLSATVYVWATGFSRTDGPAPTMAIVGGEPVEGGLKNFTVVSASFGLSWSQLKVVVDGAERAQNETAATCEPGAAEFVVCASSVLPETTSVQAGQIVRVAAALGATVRIVDTHTNAVVASAIVS